MKIVFMGTPGFATGILKALEQTEHEIVGVITAPDKPAGRGRKLNQSDVKKYALSKGMHILQPTNLKDSEFLKELESLKADLQIVVAFRMLPHAVWSMPSKGTFNLHASLLPKYRGAAPINWAIINGDKQTGLTTFFIDDKIDTGAIIKQRTLEIGKDEILKSLHDRMMEDGAALVVQTVQAIDKDNYTLTVQPEMDPSPAPKLNIENCKINWNQPSKTIYDLIRGLNPFPAAYTLLYNSGEILNTKIYDCEISDERSDRKPGTIITTKKEIKIVTGDGILNVKSLKVQGKKLMDSVSLLNGFKFEEEAYCS